LSFVFSFRIDLKFWYASIHIAEYGQFALNNDNKKYKLLRSNKSIAGDSLSSLWDNANDA